jgi:hypothetical protein
MTPVVGQKERKKRKERQRGTKRKFPLRKNREYE